MIAREITFFSAVPFIMEPLSLSLSLSARSTRNGGKRWKLSSACLFTTHFVSCRGGCLRSVLRVHYTRHRVMHSRTYTTYYPPCWSEQLTDRGCLRPTNEWKSFSGKESRKWSANVFREGTVYLVRYIEPGDARQAVR